MEIEVLHKKKLLAPKLRFKEFDGVLLPTKFGKVVESNLYGPRFNADDYSESGNVKTIRGTDLGRDGEIKYQQVPLARLDDNTVENHKLMDGDIVMITTADCGATGVFRKQEIDYLSSAYGVRIRLNKLGYPYYFKYFFQTRLARKEINSYIRKATVANLPGSDILKIKLYLPTLPEQQKIASFLSAIDEKIQQLTRKKELLEQYKKGVMQQFFSGKLRFKDENGKAFPKWEEKLLGEIAERNSTKNKSNNVNFVLTNSATQGIVSQDEYFDREIANQNNLEGYYIVAVDDFVYNPRISVHAPVGPIKRNKLKEGVMSPLYSIFRFKEKNLEYFEYYFETKGWHTYLESVSNIGARHDRMNIANSDFFKMPIPFPCLEERNKITDFLNGLSLKIESANKALTQTQTFKKGLLQQMFV